MTSPAPSASIPGTPGDTPAVRHGSHWVDRFLDGWSVYRKNTIGRIGLTLLGLFALMAVASFIPPLIDPMYHPMTGVDPHISHAPAPACATGWGPITSAGTSSASFWPARASPSWWAFRRRS